MVGERESDDGRAEFATPLAREIWRTRYGAQPPDPPELCIAETWQRVATALVAAETRDQAAWRTRFLEVLANFRFLPGGRILAGAGSVRDLTLANCFAMGTLGDAPGTLDTALAESVATMRAGGGIGCDFSSLAPAGMRLPGVAQPAAGPLAAMQRWDAACAALVTRSAARRGAMMATLRCDHPDIAQFVAAKRTPGQLQNFNLSVLISDAFMQAVADDAEWSLLFPAAALASGGDAGVLRAWPGHAGATPYRVFARLPARALWRQIVDAAYDVAEPGVLFIDRINHEDNLAYCEHIHTTNPCGEIPLPDYGACVLGSLNLTRYVRAPFSAAAALDLDALTAAVAVTVRMLDDAIAVSAYPLAAQHAEAMRCRRLGLGVTGLADALVMLGRDYGAASSAEWAGELMARLRDAAYLASCALAAAKGPCPAFARAPYLAAPFVQRLPAAVRDTIARHGVRNSHLLAIAPAGTISLLAGNLTSGIEPIFCARHTRRVRGADGAIEVHEVEDFACRQWREQGGTGLPPAYRDAGELPPSAHLAMQAAVQAGVDNAVSKTVNVPADIARDAFEHLFDLAHAQGLKGLTVYRPNAVRGAVLAQGCMGEGCSDEIDIPVAW